MKWRLLLAATAMNAIVGACVKISVDERRLEAVRKVARDSRAAGLKILVIKKLITSLFWIAAVALFFLRRTATMAHNSDNLRVFPIRAAAH